MVLQKIQIRTLHMVHVINTFLETIKIPPKLKNIKFTAMVVFKQKLSISFELIYFILFQ